MKKILITGGPTNEYIDEVMKITNMSTGSLSLALGKEFLKEKYKVVLVLNNSVNIDSIKDEKNLEVIKVETTDEMLREVKKQSKSEAFDCVIHAAAVGDYKGDFSFLMEDMAKEIFEKINTIKSEEDILGILVNPDCKLNDDSKISSYQQNLTVKLGLTPKIIGRLKEWFPETLLVGCKLLENVEKKQLYDVAQKLAIKNEMDYILANDLADLRKGDQTRYLVTKEGYEGIKLAEPKEIFDFIAGELEKERK